MLDLGIRIKNLLQRRGIKQTELAEKMGKTKQSLNSALNRPNVGSEWIMMIMEHTDITPPEIFEGYDKPSYPNSSLTEPYFTDEIFRMQKEAIQSAESAELNQEIEILKLELKLAQSDIEHLKQQLQEKERLIQVLMGERAK